MESTRRFPILKTKRLELRRPAPEDAKALLEVTRDEAVMRYYGMPAFKSEAEALGEIEWFNKIFDRAEGIRWVIAERGAAGYIGDIGLHNLSAAHARAEIGFKLASAHQGQGMMSEALGCVLAYGFGEMGLNRVEAVVDPANGACLGLLEKAGFSREGLLREYEHEEKGYVDLVMLSLLKREQR